MYLTLLSFQLESKHRIKRLKRKQGNMVKNGSDIMSDQNLFGSDIPAIGSDNVRCPTVISGPAFYSTVRLHIQDRMVFSHL